MAKRQILIVDDEHEVLDVFARALTIDGYEATIAASAQAAMESIAAAPPDAILLDLMMPFVNGIGFLYRLRATHPKIPVAIITGATQFDDATETEIRALGATLHHKPIGIAELQTLVRRLLAPQSA